MLSRNHSTRWALTVLTSEIGRDPVRFGRYGRSWVFVYEFTLYSLFSQWTAALFWKLVDFEQDGTPHHISARRTAM